MPRFVRAPVLSRPVSSRLVPVEYWPSDARPENLFLGGLNLFREPTSSFLTFLRIFMSIPFMLDVEELYDDKKVTASRPTRAKREGGWKGDVLGAQELPVMAHSAS